MKKLFLMAAVMVAGFAASAQDIKATDVISAASTEYNFGKIKQGTPVTTFFELKNTSERPLVIESALAGCGCTTPEYSKEPIAPNSVTKLKVGYNAAAMGPFTKDVTVKLAGIQQPMTLRITGEVIPADNTNLTTAPVETKPVVAAAPKTTTAKPEAQKAVKNKPATAKKSGKK
jgi:hypothetical protein